MQKTELQSLLAGLSKAVCIQSNHSAARLAMDAVKKHSASAYFDRLGNIVAPVKAPGKSGRKILLDAHLDEIGFAVTSIDENGFLRVGRVGGPDFRSLLGREVQVAVNSGGSVPGVICCRPPHLSTGEERKKLPGADEIAVDIGFDREKAEKLVSPGDFVFLCEPVQELQNGRFAGKAFDNRAGVAAVLHALDCIDLDKLDAGLTAVFSVSEECGERGARTASFSADADTAIVVDVSHAQMPDSPAEKCRKMGGGPMIGVSPVLSRHVTSGLFRTAKACGIPYQDEIMPDGTGTNSDVIAVSRGGVAVGLVSIPLRYMHTASELIDLNDVLSTGALIAAYINSLE